MYTSHAFVNKKLVQCNLVNISVTSAGVALPTTSIGLKWIKTFFFRYFFFSYFVPSTGKRFAIQIGRQIIKGTDSTFCGKDSIF